MTPGDVVTVRESVTVTHFGARDVTFRPGERLFVRECLNTPEPRDGAAVVQRGDGLVRRVPTKYLTRADR